MENSFLVALQLLLHLYIAVVSSEDYYAYGDFDIDSSDITDYVMVNSEQSNPLLAHFFNGSYSAQEIMVELMNNRSLIQSHLER